MAAEIVASLFCLRKYVGIRGVLRQLVLVEEKSAAAAWKFTGLDGTDQPRSVNVKRRAVVGTNGELKSAVLCSRRHARVGNGAFSAA